MRVIPRFTVSRTLVIGKKAKISPWKKGEQNETGTKILELRVLTHIYAARGPITATTLLNITSRTNTPRYGNNVTPCTYMALRIPTTRFVLRFYFRAKLTTIQITFVWIGASDTVDCSFRDKGNSVKTGSRYSVVPINSTSTLLLTLQE